MGNIKEVTLNLKKKEKKRLSQINKCANNTSSPTDHLLLLLHHDRPGTFCKHNTIRICSTDKKTKQNRKTKQKHNSTLFFPANIMLATSIEVWMETEWQHLALKNPNERKKTFLNKSMYIAVNNKMPARGQDNQFGLVFGIPRLCHRETMRTMYQS